MVTDLISIAGLTVLIMISPGPDLALVARNTVIGGKHAGGWTSVGILCGNLVHIGYCLLGIGWLIANSIIAFTILKLAGGAYLIHLKSLSDLGVGPGKPTSPTVIVEFHVQINFGLDVLSPDHAKISQVDEISPTCVMPNIVNVVCIVITDNDAIELVIVKGFDDVGFTVDAGSETIFSSRRLNWISQLPGIVKRSGRQGIFDEVQPNRYQ